MHTLYTIGYTGLKPAQLLTLAQRVDALIIDTRFSPRSRVPQWNGLELLNLLGQQHYKHCPELGNVNYKNGGSIQIHMPHVGTQYVVSILEKQPAVLLCACPEVETCHRRVAADLVQAACGCEVIHLSKAELAGDAPKEPRPIQGTLF